jgi:hypothetical protein
MWLVWSGTACPGTHCQKTGEEGGGGGAARKVELGWDREDEEQGVEVREEGRNRRGGAINQPGIM